VRRLAIATALATVPLAACGEHHHGAVIRVPDDVRSLTQAIAQAHSGDTIVVGGGTYPGGVTVPKRLSNLTIRGVDRNKVVLDGRNRRKNGIVVHADGVSILNMTAHDFLENAFYWEDVTGFRAAYLTAWNIQGYGIYAEGSTDGVIEHDYVSGAADAAYYIGECRPCRSTISHVVARRSAVGYSGTNASTALTIRDSLWDENGAGILPNTYANEKDPPEEKIVITGNVVRESGRAPVPIHTPLAGFIGIGIAIAGGNGNIVRGNTVQDSERYGIAIFPTARRVSFRPEGLQLRPYWHPRGNRVVGNHVSGSGRADLALSAGAGRGNCFAKNVAGSMLPPALQTGGCLATGDSSVAAVLTAPVAVMFDRTIRRRRPPGFASLPAPPPQPSLP
jgi:parallel beta-helix repeat protein